MGLTNISPGYLRLKSPILLVSWLPLSEDAGVTEIGQIGIMTEREERTTAAGVQSVRTGNTQTSTGRESVGKYFI